MFDDPKKAGLNHKRISLKEPYAVRSWTDWLGVTEQQLKAAVAAVGSSTKKVRSTFARSSSEAPRPPEELQMGKGHAGALD